MSTSLLKLTIFPLTLKDLDAFLKFTDQQIGQNYYTKDEAARLIEPFQGSASPPLSFALKNESQEILGVRLSLGNEEVHRLKNLNKLSLSIDELSPVGYFKSLFLHPDCQKQGWGQKLSLESINSFKTLHYKAIVAHSWKESPHNSSFKYLQKLGFQTVQEHPLFWSEIDYNCTRCLSPPCQCTAIEMILHL